MPSDLSPCTDLQRAYLEHTTKLAKLTATLGLNGDESTEILVARARFLVLTRERLFSAGTLLLASAVPSLGQVFVTPAALDQLATALDRAAAQKLHAR